MAFLANRGGFTYVKPSGPPTLAAGTASGSLTNAAVYQYKVTYFTAYGETDGNTSAASFTATSTGSIALSAIPVSADTNTSGRRLYRTAGNGSTFLLLASLNDNTTTTYVDTIADGSLGAAIPALNSAHSNQKLDGIVKLVQPCIYSITDAITAHAGGGQSSAVPLVSEYNNVTVVANIGDSVVLPVVSANLIGMRIVVVNHGANSMNVFPAVGQDASAGANTAIAVAAAGGATFVCNTATTWAKFV